VHGVQNVCAQTHEMLLIDPMLMTGMTKSVYTF
jgi:hypothetical protein